MIIYGTEHYVYYYNKLYVVQKLNVKCVGWNWKLLCCIKSYKILELSLVTILTFWHVQF